MSLVAMSGCRRFLWAASASLTEGSKSTVWFRDSLNVTCCDSIRAEAGGDLVHAKTINVNPCKCLFHPWNTQGSCE